VAYHLAPPLAIVAANLAISRWQALCN